LQGVLLVVTSGTVDEGQIVPLTRDGEIRVYGQPPCWAFMIIRIDYTVLVVLTPIGIDVNPFGHPLGNLKRQTWCSLF